MAVKKCCIEKCKSCSTRKEDVGVTYHKFPKQAPARDAWVQVTRHLNEIELSTYVCSRHFCMRDFQMYQGSKYVLKSGAVPSIFPWTKGKLKKNMDELDSLETKDAEDDKNNLSSSSKESEPENLEAIKRFIENHEKLELVPSKAADLDKTEKIDDSWTEIENNVSVSSVPNKKEETLSIASSVIDLIFNESASKLKTDVTTPETSSPMQNDSSGDKGTVSVSLSVGSKVQAKDFAENWYVAEIVEVDYDEMEVLVRYENDSKKSEEWINVNSPRLRPVTADAKPVEMKAKVTKPIEVTPEVVEEKSDDKPKVMFAVGERCLARWRDNRRFVATIQSDLGNGSYEIVFDDGFLWKCSGSRMSKLKDSAKTEWELRGGSSAPTPGAGPSTSTASSPLPPFHTHLFDPTRDYLGSKSERRELKRKLNIKEILNIGQKQKRKIPAKDEKPKPRAKKPKLERDNTKVEKKAEVNREKKEIPDAIASIIGTVIKDDAIRKDSNDKISIKNNGGETSTKTGGTSMEGKSNAKNGEEEAMKSSKIDSEEIDIHKDDDNSSFGNKDTTERETDALLIDEETQSAKLSDTEFDTFDNHDDTCADYMSKLDPIQEEETKLQNFEKPDEQKHEQVMDRIKEAINKLEDGLNRDLVTPSPNTVAKVSQPIQVPQEDKLEEAKQDESKEPDVKEAKAKPAKRLKKSLKLKKKLRMLEEQGAVKLDELNSKLEEMKMKMNEMEMEMLRKTQALEQLAQKKTMLENVGNVGNATTPPEWCCRWVNGEPVGITVDCDADTNTKTGDVDKLVLPRKTIQVQDSRLPEGWTKLMVRRTVGNSAGKWDVVLVSPENRRFHTKTDMRNYLDNAADPSLKEYQHALLDFAIHLKLSRRRGWVAGDCGRGGRGKLKRKMFRRDGDAKPSKKRKLHAGGKYKFDVTSFAGPSDSAVVDSSANMPFDNATVEDGFVNVGTVKVQVIENLLRCPAEGCLKNFRNSTLLRMHIKHYHREMRKLLGDTPKVLDLAYARAVPVETETKPRHEPDNRIIKVKIPRPPKRVEEPKLDVKELNAEATKLRTESPKIPRSLDSPLMRQMQSNRPVKRPKVLLPVRRSEPVEPPPELEPIEEFFDDTPLEPMASVPQDILDFEKAISTHTVTRPPDAVSKKPEKRKVTETITKPPTSEDEELGMNSDVETRSSYPGSSTPESKTLEVKGTMQGVPMSSESNEDAVRYIYTETGEYIKLERMKREEIINCHCGYREEDGLMVQCELCLCWQHALCHEIEREADVPPKYMCHVCVNPRRGRRSRRHAHDQERMTHGRLPGAARPAPALRRAHRLAESLLLVGDALHALRVQYHVANTRNHPKLYLWATDWDRPESPRREERQDPYPDLSLLFGVGKENVPSRDGPSTSRMELPALSAEDLDDSQKDGSSTSSFAGLLASPGGPSLDMPISASELETLARSVQEQEAAAEAATAAAAPQPEAPIRNSDCRERLLRHVQRCQALIDARLDTLEADIVELEAQEPSFEDDETADYFPRTKHTIAMLMRDLETLQQLALVT